MINSRVIEDLDSLPAAACRRHVALCLDASIELLVTSTYRDFEAQAELHAIGRTAYMQRRPVTNAKAGRSWHNFRCAWDVVPIVGGKAVWNSRDPVWLEVIRLGKEAGAAAGAEWKSFPDRPHFQVIPSLAGSPITLVEAVVRWNAQGTIFTV